MTIDNDFYDFKNRRAIRPHPPPLRQGWESDETAPLEVVMETTQSSPVKAGETFQNLRLAPMPLIHQYLLRRQELLNRWSWFRPFQIGRPFLGGRSEEHTSELQSQFHLVCRLLLEKKKKK